MELLFLCVTFYSDCRNRSTHGETIGVQKGLMAAGKDIWVQKLSGKALDQGYVPATVSVAHLVFAHYPCLSRCTTPCKRQSQL